MPGRRSRARAADQAHSTSSYWPWSRPARPRQKVAASGRRGFPAVSSGAPSRCRRSAGADAAHSAAASGCRPRPCPRPRQRAGSPGGDAALPPAQVVHRAQEPAQPRDLGIIPAAGHCFAGPVPRGPCAGRRAPGRPAPRPARRGPPRAGPAGSRDGRTSSGGGAGRNSGTAGRSGITAGSTSGTRARHSKGMADLSTRGSFADSVIFRRRTSVPRGTPHPRDDTRRYPDALTP